MVVKVYRVAGGNTQTALGLVQAAGAAAVLLGAVLSVLPGLFGFALWGLTLGIISRTATRLQRRIMIEAATILVLIETVTLGFLRTFQGVVVLGILLALFVWLGRRFGEKWNMFKNVEVLSVAPAVFVTLFVTAQPWVPAEQVTVAERDPVVGYVMSDDGPWFKSSRMSRVSCW